MADHVRKLLRAAIVTRLTGLATTGSNVFGHRVRPLEGTQLPALSIYIVSESAENATVHAPAVIERLCEVRVRGIAAVSPSPDDTLDQIAKEVEAALATALTVATGRTVQLDYAGCEIEIEEAERPVGVIELQYRARIFNAANAPDVFV